MTKTIIYTNNGLYKTEFAIVLQTADVENGTRNNIQRTTKKIIYIKTEWFFFIGPFHRRRMEREAKAKVV